MRTLAIDLETYSELELGKVGLYKYAENCKILLCAYAYDDEPVQIVDLASGEKLPATFIAALYDPRILKTAYNAAFEINVLSKYLRNQLDSTQWQCTMVQGLSLGLPSGLEKLGEVLKIESDKKKMTEGKKLVKYFSMPRQKKQPLKQQTKKKSPEQTSIFDDVIENLFGMNESNSSNVDGSGILFYDSEDNSKDFFDNCITWLFSEKEKKEKNPFIQSSEDKEKWNQFKEYCKRDVESERAIRKRLEKYSPNSTERRLWVLDQTINNNGVWIDMELVKGAMRVDEFIKAEALKAGEDLTGGLNINSNVQMKQWVEEQIGHQIESLDKASRESLQQGELTPQVLEFFRLKDIVSKTSISKFETMRETACADHRARGMFKFCGASRTGRWSGLLIQLQNLPQNHIEDLETARELVRRGNAYALDVFYENPAEVLSQLIRTAFVAVKGSRLIVADFSAIEARILSWLANEQWRMEVFAQGGDIYCASASEMFKVPVEKHGVNHELRAKGKVAELACGYGGGVSALKAFGADKMGLSDKELETIVKKWRKSNPNICTFWRIMESCAKIAIKNCTKKYCQKGIAFEYRDNFLFVTLPSGRTISYYNPQIEYDEHKHQEVITYEGNSSSGESWGKNSTWGGKLVENIVQAIARDCLGVAMLKLDVAGYKIIMHVHDEVIMEMPEGVGSLDEVLKIMSQPLYWARELKLTAEGYETPYYKKDN